METLYVTDLDGTLLTSKNCISKYSLTIINKLIEKGMHFTYATARSLNSASVVTKGLTTKIPIIAYNGTMIFDAATGKILNFLSFTEKEAQDVIKILNTCKVSPLVYSFIQGEERVSWVTGKENEGIRYYLSQRKGDKRLRPLSNEEGLFDGNIYYFSCIGEKEKLMILYNAFSKDNRFTCTIQQELYRTEYWCEIMPKKATKAEACQTLKEMLECDRIVSFGDAINDIPLFKISDECYAVANAIEPLKTLATGVIGSNEEDGVAKFLLERSKSGKI